MWFVKKEDRPYKSPNEAERALQKDRRYKERVVRPKKKYTRKGRKPSMRQFEGSFQITICRYLIEN